MLKLKQNEKEVIKSLFGTKLGKESLSIFRDVIIRGVCEPANASDGQMYSLLMAREEAKLGLLRYFIKLGENDGKRS